MIGAVYTRAQRRGEGMASHLLTWAMEKLQQDGLDFAVLWAGRPAFYERLGWIVADCGLLGEIENNVIVPESEAVVNTMPVKAVDYEQVENIRESWLTALTWRHVEDYRQLPLPANFASTKDARSATAKTGFSRKSAIMLCYTLKRR